MVSNLAKVFSKNAPAGNLRQLEPASCGLMVPVEDDVFWSWTG